MTEGCSYLAPDSAGIQHQNVSPHGWEVGLIHCDGFPREQHVVLAWQILSEHDRVGLKASQLREFVHISHASQC